MSTKGTEALVEITDNGYYASIHVYTECMKCMEGPPVSNLYFTMWQEGHFDNYQMTLAVPKTEALAFCEALGKWARETREWDAKQETKCTPKSGGIVKPTRENG